MTTLTPRQTFRETVALVAARAKARLPEAVNGRIESAVKLVLSHDVTPEADGSTTVGSSTDPLKTYRLVGPTCDCQDFVRGQAPEGWCQHRIAAGIHRRVQAMAPEPTDVLQPETKKDEQRMPSDLLQPYTLPEAPMPAAPPLPEAPASVNVRLTIGGREVQWTLRDTDEARLAVRLEALLARYPVPQTQLAAPSQEQGEDWCRKHQRTMQHNTKNGRQWYSHRLEDGTWYKGR
jgi:hypothetical protein